MFPFRRKLVLPGEAEIKAGDLIAFSGHSWISAAINIATYGIPYWGISHIGIMAKAPDGRLLIFESTSLENLPCEIRHENFAGTQAHLLDDVLRVYVGKAWLYPLYRSLYHPVKSLEQMGPIASERQYGPPPGSAPHEQGPLHRPARRIYGNLMGCTLASRSEHMSFLEDLPRHRPNADDQPITTLCISLWTPADGRRKEEIDACLHHNLACAAIDRIVVFSQATKEHRAEFVSPKLLWVQVPEGQRRANFSDMCGLVNAVTTTPHDLNIIANSDVFFDESISLVKPYDLNHICLAISRYEYRSDGQYTPSDLAGDNAIDVWMFQGRIRPFAADFPLGVWCCDWRFNWLLHDHDYALYNPCLDVRCYHLHASGVRDNAPATPGPYYDRVPHCTLADTPLRFGRSERGVIAYSLYGAAPKYCHGAVENARNAKFIYPAWTVRYYVDDTVPSTIKADLRHAGAEVVECPPNDDHSGMMWRLHAIDDPGFTRWVIRDADSRIGYKERAAVDAWIDSGLPFHVMRDHMWHRKPIIGGSWGGVRGGLRNMNGCIEEWYASGGGKEHGAHEEFLASEVWPEIRDCSLIHDTFLDPYGFGGLVWPYPRESGNFRFITERIYEDDHHDGDAAIAYARDAGQPRRPATRGDLIRIAIAPGSVVAELGIFCGDLSHEVLHRCRPSRLYLVDTWQGEAFPGDKDGRNIRHVEDMVSPYRKLLAEHLARRPEVTLMRGRSVDCLGQMSNGTLDAVYIDTTHAYEDTAALLAISWEKVRPGGVILGHGYDCESVSSAVHDFCASHRVNLEWLTRDGCPSFGFRRS